MKKDNLHDKNIIKKCDVCVHDIWVDQFGFGSCSNCGWENSSSALENPDYPYVDNFLSFNNAKMLYSEGKKLAPNFDEFLELVRVYGEVQFAYKNKVYGVIRGDKIELFCDQLENSLIIYESFEDFKQKAAIEGVLLKEIWDLIEAVNYLQ